MICLDGSYTVYPTYLFCYIEPTETDSVNGLRMKSTTTVWYGVRLFGQTLAQLRVDNCNLTLDNNKNKILFVYK